MNFIPCRPSFCSLPLLLLLSPATQERLTSAQQPHILLIVADDLGYNDVSWHNPAMVMPNLDTLARYLQYLQYLDIKISTLHHHQDWGHPGAELCAAHLHTHQVCPDDREVPSAHRWVGADLPLPRH